MENEQPKQCTCELIRAAIRRAAATGEMVTIPSCPLHKIQPSEVATGATLTPSELGTIIQQMADFLDRVPLEDLFKETEPGTPAGDNARAMVQAAMSFRNQGRISRRFIEELNRRKAQGAHRN